MDVILFFKSVNISDNLRYIYNAHSNIIKIHKPIFHIIVEKSDNIGINLINHYMKHVINEEYYIYTNIKLNQKMNELSNIYIDNFNQKFNKNIKDYTYDELLKYDIKLTSKYLLITEPEILEYNGLYTAILENKNSKITFNNSSVIYYKKRYINDIKDVVLDPINKINEIKIEDIEYYFNRYKDVSNNRIFKSAVTDIGKDMIKNEVNWYKYMLNNYDIACKELIPNIYELYDYGYLIEKTIPLKYDNLSILLIINKLDKLHNLKTVNIDKKVFYSNLKNEIYDKIKSINIEPIIKYYIRDIEEFQKDNFENILIKCKNIITQYYSTIEEYKYYIIHGKPFITNIIEINNLNQNLDENLNKNQNQNQNQNLKFINPRGYFGKTLIYGIKEYDYGALLSSIFIKYELNEINKNNELNEIMNRYFNKVHIALSIIIAYSELENYINNPKLLYNLYKKIIEFSKKIIEFSKNSV